MTMTMSAATTVPPGYYASFESQTRAMTPPPDERKLLDRADKQALLEAKQQIEALALLEEGWNGYDALPPSPASVNRAMHWLDNSYILCKDAGVRWYKPNVSASAEGEVVFWWVADDRSLNVYIDAGGATFHQSLRDDGLAKHTHGDAPLGGEQAKLMRWFGE